MMANSEPARRLARYRVSLTIFIVGLVISGVTAFPLLTELRLLSHRLGIEDPSRYAEYDGLRHWIAFVHAGLATTYERFPFVGYGTDWLAFGHLALAFLIAGAFRHPVQRAWILRYAVVLCFAVVPTAFVAGAIRGIPIYWRLIDCSFGVFGVIPLLDCLRTVRQLERTSADR